MSRAHFVIAALGVGSHALVAKDEVTSLPGWDAPLPSKQFSGYLDIGGGKKHLHYWMIQAEASATVDPATAPTVLWLVSAAPPASYSACHDHHVLTSPVPAPAAPAAPRTAGPAAPRSTA